MRNQKGISTFFAILVVGIVAIIGFTIVFSYQWLWTPEEEAKLPEIGAPEDETVSWKIYEDREFGFEFKYSAKYNFEGPDITHIGTKLDLPYLSVYKCPVGTTEGCDFFDLTIVRNVNNLELSEFVFVGPTNTPITPITIAGIKGITTNSRLGGLYAGKILKEAVISKGDYIFIFTSGRFSNKNRDTELEIDKIISTFRFIEVEEGDKNSLDKEAEITEGPPTYSHDKKLSVYTKRIVYPADGLNKAIMEIHLYNQETGEDKIIKTDSCCIEGTGCGICPWPCGVDSFSPNNKYILQDCGTSPLRSLKVIDVETGDELVHFSSFVFYYWLDNEEIIFHEPQDDGRPWGGGEEVGIAKINVVSGNKTILREADDLHDYHLVKLLEDRNILFTLKTYPAEGGWERFDNPSITHWIMDSDGNIIEQVYDLKQYQD